MTQKRTVVETQRPLARDGNTIGVHTNVESLGPSGARSVYLFRQRRRVLVSEAEVGMRVENESISSAHVASPCTGS